MTSLALAGQMALVTGASRGLGRAIALAFARAGAHVALVARDRDALLATTSDAKSVRATADQIVEAYASDVSDPADMQRVVEHWSDLAGAPTVLVNNAGMLGPIGIVDAVDWASWRRTIEVNLLAPARLSRLVLPGMRRAGYGKIINVSGGGATAPRPHFSAYATAKCGLVSLTETLASELAGTGVDVNAIAPGPMNTTMLEQVLSAGATAAGPEYQKALTQHAEGGVPPETAAALVVFLASRASDGITGRLLSAVWDPWERLAERRPELEASDIYTLRRIVPSDRGRGWDAR